MIYLDHHATTPVDPRVLEAMLPFFTEKFGNAASRQHRFGWDAQRAVERARKQVAALDRRRTAKEIVFTSGATEANNLAIKGVADGEQRRTAITSSRWRPSTRRCSIRAARCEQRRLARRRCCRSTRDGLIDLDALRAMRSRERTALVSVMAANNEIGVLQPIADDRRDRAREGRAGSTPTRCRRSGKVPFDVEALDVDLASLTRPQDLRAEGCRRACMCGAGTAA